MDCAAVPWQARQNKCCTDRIGALAHSSHSEMAGGNGARIEAATIIAQLQMYSAISSVAQCHGRVLRLSMFDDVPVV